MQFKEFVNRSKNVVGSGSVRRIATSIPITEQRNAFFNGELFKKYDIVESDGKLYRLLEQCSNYYQVVDEEGNLSRKFAKQLIKLGNVELTVTESRFHGYEVKTEQAKAYLSESFDINSTLNDDVGILKQLKKLDEQMEEYKTKDKLVIAKMIADTIGVPYDNVSTPDNLVSAAIRKAKKDPALMKNKALIANMIQIAKEVGIHVSDKTFDVNESEEIKEATHEVTVDHHGSNQQVPLYTKTYKVTANSDKEASDHVKKFFGGRNHRVKPIEKLKESEQLDELSISTLKSYKDVAKSSATKLISQGAKAKKLETGYAKMSKASKRLSSVSTAEKKIFSKDWKDRTGQNESLEESEELKTSMTYEEMMKLYKPEAEAEAHELPHGHNFGHTSETNRKQIIKKLRNV